MGTRSIATYILSPSFKKTQPYLVTVKPETCAVVLIVRFVRLKNLTIFVSTILDKMRIIIR